MQIFRHLSHDHVPHQAKFQQDCFFVCCKHISYYISLCIPVQNKLDRKRTFTEEQHEEGNNLSPLYPHGPEEPLSSCLSCEAVPVIQHASACRKQSPMQHSGAQCYDLNVVSDLHQRKSDSSQIVHFPSVHKLGDYKLYDDNLYEPVCKKVKVAPSPVHAHQTESPKDSDDELLKSRSGAFVKTSFEVSPKTVCVSAQVRQAKHKEDDLSPHTEASRSFILCNASRNEGCQSHQHLNKAYEHSDDASDQHRLGENEHSVPCASLEFSDASASVPVDSSHCISGGHVEPGQHDVLCPLRPEADKPYAVQCRSRDKYSQAVGMQTSRSSTDSKSWFDLDRCNAQGPVVSSHGITEDTPTLYESARDDRSSISESSSVEQEEDCDLFSSQISGVHTYQGQVRYHCISGEPQQVSGSSDSDEEGLHALSVDAAGSKHGSEADLGVSKASVSEPTIGTFDLGKTQTTSGLNLAAQPYQCSMCDRAFSQRGSLNRHMRSHLGVRPYSCPQCPMTFSRQYRVTEHMRVHQRGCEDLQRSGPT